MCKTSIILLALLTVLGTASAQEESPDCSKQIPVATGLEQSFPIVTKETIAKDTKCTYTITAASPHKIMVYLAVNGTATESQCISIENVPKPICGKQNENTYTSNGQQMTVKYTYADKSDSVPNFLVMYKYGNNDYCTSVSPIATDSENSFEILRSGGSFTKDTYCSWTIMTNNPQKIVVRLAADATEKQCVSVSNSPKEAGKKICGKQADNTFTSTGQQVTVTYSAPDPADDIKNFAVFYKAENSKECSTNIPEASTLQQSFPVTTTDNIPKGTQCMWKIKATSAHKILVYLTVNGTATETQCVTVDNNPTGSPKTICGKQNDNTFTSTGQEVTVTYTFTGEGESASNFMVMYKFANSDACTVASPMATDTEQSFGIINKDETIPSNAYCSWTITAPSPKRVMVHLMVDGTTTENQCVSASSKPSEAGKKICGKQNENEFTSNEQQLTITYPIPQAATGVKNFKVFYKASGARRDTAWIVGILSACILSRLLL